jgi:very-short-patch-repair endonuclease
MAAQWRIALEYEGDHHREKAQFRRDIARVNALRRAGWLVLRFTADDVLRRPHTVVEHVAAAIRERR